jgi:hypothetical protein
MKKLIILFCALSILFLISIKGGWSLPPCPADINPSPSHWSECFGTYTFANGNKYEGEYEDGKRHGQGTFIFADGEMYLGEFKNGNYHGKSIYTFANGNKYIGQWQGGKFNGPGTFYYLAEDQSKGDKYIGEWKGGEFFGEGTYYYLAANEFNGDIYIGEIKDGKPNGEGVYTSTTGKKYVGEFRKGKQTGQGAYTFASPSKFSGDIYVGDVKGGKPNGQGTYTWGPASEFAGDTYVGEWKNAKKNGQGIYTFADGRVQEGVWENNSFKYAQKIVTRPNRQSSLGVLPEVKKQLEELKKLQKNMAGLERWNTSVSEDIKNLGELKKSLTSEKDKPNAGSLVAKLKQWWSSLFSPPREP